MIYIDQFIFIDTLQTYKMDIKSTILGDLCVGITVINHIHNHIYQTY